MHTFINYLLLLHRESKLLLHIRAYNSYIMYLYIIYKYNINISISYVFFQNVILLWRHRDDLLNVKYCKRNKIIVRNEHINIIRNKDKLKHA